MEGRDASSLNTLGYSDGVETSMLSGFYSVLWEMESFLSVLAFANYKFYAIFHYLPTLGTPYWVHSDIGKHFYTYTTKSEVSLKYIITDPLQCALHFCASP